MLGSNAFPVGFAGTSGRSNEWYRMEGGLFSFYSHGSLLPGGGLSFLLLLSGETGVAYLKSSLLVILNVFVSRAEMPDAGGNRTPGVCLRAMAVTF